MLEEKREPSTNLIGYTHSVSLPPYLYEGLGFVKNHRREKIKIFL